MTGLVCPNCRGKKRGPVLSCGPLGSKLEEQDCRVCNGVGKISAVRKRKIEWGLIARQDRIARRESLMDAAKRCAVKTSTVSAIENGRFDYEDELPTLSDLQYGAWFKESVVLCGVRVGPEWPR